MWRALLVCLLIGCVQVDTDPLVNRPDEIDSKEVAGADPVIVQDLLAASDLQDSARLRRYAALYAANAELLTKQPEVPVADVLAGVLKATRLFVNPPSEAMAVQLKKLMPESAGAETDRTAIAAGFSKLSASCHAAAHEIDKRKSGGG